MSEWKAKRFWTAVNVEQTADGFGVLLDERPLRTPAKVPLVVPTQELAQMIAAEWDAQVDEIDPTTMPATRTANVTIDKVAFQMREVADHVAEYGGTDLICYRAKIPPQLAERQAQAWDPLLDWAHSTLGADLRTGIGVMPVAQDTAAERALADQVGALPPFALSALSEMVSALGSLVLALAVHHGRLTPQDAWAMSLIDDHFQREQWGADEEALEMEAAKQAAFLDAVAFLKASGPQA